MYLVFQQKYRRVRARARVCVCVFGVVARRVHRGGGGRERERERESWYFIPQATTKVTQIYTYIRAKHNSLTHKLTRFLLYVLFCC